MLLQLSREFQKEFSETEFKGQLHSVLYVYNCSFFYVPEV